VKCSEHVISFDKEGIELYDAGLMGNIPCSHQVKTGLFAKTAVILKLWLLARIPIKNELGETTIMPSCTIRYGRRQETRECTWMATRRMVRKPSIPPNGTFFVIDIVTYQEVMPIRVYRIL